MKIFLNFSTRHIYINFFLFFFLHSVAAVTRLEKMKLLFLPFCFMKQN